MRDEAGSLATAGARQTADAVGLFESNPAPVRRRKGAEARAQTRRCPTCGGMVPAGMSLCQTCGLDLETGFKVSLVDDLSPATIPRNEGMPISVALIGFLALGAAILLTILPLVKWLGGLDGAQYFIPCGAFGIYAAVQMLRLKTVKLLLAALALAAGLDVVTLIAMPIYKANADTTLEQRTELVDDSDVADVRIKPISERLDTDQLSLGIALLFACGVVSIALISPPIQKHFRR